MLVSEMLILILISEHCGVPAQVSYHFACDDQARCGGHKRRASRYISSFRTLMLRAGRTDAVRPATDCHIFKGSDGFFFGIYDL